MVAVETLVDHKIERALVAALIAQPTQHDKLHDVGLDVLADFQAQHAFEAFANVRSRGEEVTKSTVRVELERRLEHKDLAWFDALAIETKPDALVAKWAQRIIQLARRRAATIADAEPFADACNVSNVEIDEFALRDVGDRTTSTFLDSVREATDAGPAKPIRRGRRRVDLVETILAHAAEPTVELALGSDTIATVRLGATVVLIGASGRGKTSLASTLLVEHARGNGPAIAMSLELPEDELAARVIGTRCDAGWADVLSGRIPREHMLDALPERLSVIERQHATLEALRVEIDAMRAEYPDEPILVAVDYVQLVPGEDDEPRMRVDAAMRAVDEIARSRRVVVIALSQGSRASAKALSSGELMGAQTTDAGAESAAIERWASLTLAIGEHGPEADDGSCATSISIGKFRMGRGDAVLPARYHGRSGLWRLTGEARPAAEVRAERQDARSEAQIATLMLAIRSALEQAAGPLSDRQLGELVTGKAILRRQARARLLADPTSGIVQCGRQSGGRKPSYPVWTRAKAEAAALAIHDGHDGEDEA